MVATTSDAVPPDQRSRDLMTQGQDFDVLLGSVIGNSRSAAKAWVTAR